MSSRAMEYLTSFFKIVFKYLINTATRGGVWYYCAYMYIPLPNINKR